uniref:Sirohydrochlorin ferrochelatase n=1 Tax=Tetraselmis sp. GSL018 TaxID=582737 RepID=A0A061R717_9CHLO
MTSLASCFRKPSRIQAVSEQAVSHPRRRFMQGADSTWSGAPARVQQRNVWKTSKVFSTRCYPHIRDIPTCLSPNRRVFQIHSARSAQASASGEVAVVIVDHGSKKEESNKMLYEFAEIFRNCTQHKIVECAHMEIAQPGIKQAVKACAEQGAKTVVIAPYFLSRGRHIQKDIPELVREAQLEFSDLECIIADPIGVDPLLAELIEKRVQLAVDSVSSATN